MRSTMLVLSLVALMGATATATGAIEVAAQTYAVLPGPRVHLVDPGTEPRQVLSYSLTVGQTDRFELTTSSTTHVVLQDESAPWPETAPLLATAEQTVLARNADGNYDIETVYTDVGVLDTAVDPLVAGVLGRQVGTLAGTRTRHLIDEHGRVLLAETIEGPDYAASGIHLGVMPGLIDTNSLQATQVLPHEPVGVGAVWEVTSETVDPVTGLPLALINTTTLVRRHADGTFELSGEGSLGPQEQQLSPPGSDHVYLSILSVGDMSDHWTIDPTRYGPEGDATVELFVTRTPTAEGVDLGTIAMRMELRTERLDAE